MSRIPFAKEPHLRELHGVLERAADLDAGDERDRHAQECVAAVGRALEPIRQPLPPLTALEEIAGLVLDLRWKELVDLGAALEKTEGSDQAARMWAWAHTIRA